MSNTMWYINYSIRFDWVKKKDLKNVSEWYLDISFKTDLSNSFLFIILIEIILQSVQLET